MSHALLIVDERPEAGRGHSVRSRALAAELERRGWTFDFLEQDESGWGDVLIVDTYHNQGDAPIHAGDARIVQIADSHSLMPTLLSSKSETARPHLIVDGGAGASAEQYASSGARLILAGPEYALLREPFRAHSWKPTHPAWTEDFRDMAGQTAEHVASEMASVTVAISYAGMRALELACIGTPSILFVESPDQEANAQALQKRCAGIIAYTEDYARKQVKQLLKDPDWLARMSHAGRSLVDGKGCIRVADEIERLVA